MKESLLQEVLKLLDTIESPVILHSEAAAYPAAELAVLRAKDMLRPPLKADRVPRPKRYGPGPDVDVNDGPLGLMGVVADDTYHYEPIPLTDEDTWYYPISLPHLVDAIRKENGIDGTGFRNEGGLIYVGQRSVDGVAIVDVYFSSPNCSADSVIARCRRLEEIAKGCQLALLTPRPLDILIGDRGNLASNGITVISLMAAARRGHFRVSWGKEFGRVAAGLPAVAGSAGVGPDLERLVQNKRHLNVATAARYLERTGDHVRRLVASGDLVRLGRGRPLKISVESLRLYKGTAETGSSQKSPA